MIRSFKGFDVCNILLQLFFSVWQVNASKLLLPKSQSFFFSILGLPPTGSWQDLKDHMREAGDVCFADVQRDGEGVVEFLRREDMEYALRRLDRTEFRSHQVSFSGNEKKSSLIFFFSWMIKQQMSCLFVGWDFLHPCVWGEDYSKLGSLTVPLQIQRPIFTSL